MALAPVPTIDPALPVPPNPADEEAVFDAKAYAWSNALPGFGGDVKAIGDATYANAQWAQTKAAEASASAGESAGSADTAEAWAIKTDGLVDGSDNGAKAWAIGGTGAGQPALGDSKSWATKTGAAVAGSEYSAKEYAVGDAVPSGSAKEWATAATSPDGTTAQSAKTYAAQAEASAGNAATSEDNAEASAIEASKLNLGPKTAPPTVDNQGQPLLQGATYYDTTLDKWRVWNGVEWAAGISAVAGVSSINGLTGDVSGFVTENGTQTLTNKTLTNPLLSLGGSNGTSGQVPVSQGAGLPVIWGAGSEIIRVARTSNTAISSANKGNLIDITSGTFTQTFNACSTLGNGWFCYLRNSGTGDITLDPNASEMIDGLTGYVMYPGEVRLVQCDGVALRTVVLNGFYKVFTSSGNFITPPGYTAFKNDAISGGAGGHSPPTSTAAGGAGGVGGSRNITCIESKYVGIQEIVTVGAGGAGASSGQGDGGIGGATTFGGHTGKYLDFFTNSGGAGGAQQTGNAAGNPGSGSLYAGAGGGGGGYNQSNASNGGSGGSFGQTGTGSGGIAGNSSGVLYGGNGVSDAYSGRGGQGGGGGAVTYVFAPYAGRGGNGAIPGGGGGGGGSFSNLYRGAGGDGARGELRIWGII